MTYGTVNADVIGTSVAGSNLGAGNASIMKNRIINGAMVIDQRNAGASVTPINGQYLVDRFTALLTQTSKFSAQQNAGSVTPPVGFTNYLGITSLSSFSVTSTDILGIGQYIEGFNTADLGWGTANAKTVTLSFQVYSSLTGTFGGVLQNSAASRSYPFSYSIPVANTWTPVSVTIAGDTTGTWVGATNGVGLRVIWGLGCGSSVSGTAGAWAGAGYYSATGATSVVGTSGATFYITGVQLEVGSSATGFEYRQYQQELALCQRYFASSFPWGVAPSNGQSDNRGAIGTSFNSTNMQSNTIALPVYMRTAPTTTYYSTNGTTTGNNWAYYNAGWISASPNSTNVAPNYIQPIFTTPANSYGQSFIMSGFWTASAEL